MSTWLVLSLKRSKSQVQEKELIEVINTRGMEKDWYRGETSEFTNSRFPKGLSKSLLLYIAKYVK